MKNNPMTAQKQRVSNDGPNVYLLARKAETLGDHVVCPKNGKPRLAHHKPYDAVNALSCMRAKKFITEAEWQAGEMVSSARRRLFGLGVTAAPSFYRAMVADSEAEQDPLTGERVVGETIDDDEREERRRRARELYDDAILTARRAGAEEEASLRNLVCGDWWPESVSDIRAVRSVLGVLARKWRLEEGRMEEDKPILCLDFDGVIHSFRSGWQGARNIHDLPVKGAIEFIVEATDVFKVAVHSSRSGHPGGIQAMQTWLLNALIEHFKGDQVSAFRYLSLIDFPVHKPNAMVSIDDRAMTFSGKWSDFNVLALRNFKTWTEGDA